MAGIYPENAAELQAKLLRAEREGEAALSPLSPYGERYVIDFLWERQRRTVTFRSTWILDLDAELPRLTSCFVL